MDNFFELIPFLLIILWSIFGAKGAKQKQEERRRAEEERRAREARQRTGGFDARDTGERVEREGRRETGVSTGTQTTGSTQQDDSAAGMVPEDLWAILTGGTPHPTRPQPPVRVPPRAEPTPEPEYEADFEPERVEPGGWVTSPPWDEEDAVNSIEGVSYETTTRERVDYDAAADATARARYEDLREWSWDERARPEATSFASDETSDRRHVAFHTRLRDREGEIGSATETARRPSLHERLGLGDLGQVRRAIVLAEVLGPPKSLRD